MFDAHLWKGKTCFVVQCFKLLYSDSLSIFRIFLPIHSSVECRNLSHQLIYNSSQRHCFNNSSGNVSIPQLHCCMIYFLLSFDFCRTFRAHTPQLSFELFLLEQMPMTIQLENSQNQVNCFHLTLACSMVLNTLIHSS